MKTCYLSIFLLISFLAAKCQFLENGGMEGGYGISSCPDEWHPCNANSSPDSGPIPSSEVNLEPSEGYKYLILVTRGKESSNEIKYEDIDTRLLTNLSEGVTYRFSIDLAQTKFRVNSFGYIIDVNNPITIRIYGNSSRCEKRELIFESPIIDHYEWRTYEFDFVPISDNINSLFIEADFINNDSIYFGNMALDNLIIEEFNNYHVPNVITPNADGYNDKFIIDMLPPKTRLEIFDRWGKLVYQSDSYQNDWEGTATNGSLLESGNYWYVLKPKNRDANLQGMVFVKRMN